MFCVFVKIMLVSDLLSEIWVIDRGLIKFLSGVSSMDVASFVMLKCVWEMILMLESGICRGLMYCCCVIKLVIEWLIFVVKKCFEYMDGSKSTRSRAESTVSFVGMMNFELSGVLCLRLYFFFGILFSMVLRLRFFGVGVFGGVFGLCTVTRSLSLMLSSIENG